MAYMILEDVKDLLGLPIEENAFDSEVMIHINSSMMVLGQLGFPQFFMTRDSTWQEYLGERADLESVKSYIYLKVKLLFDPPTGSVLSAFETQIKELEWRLNVQVETSNNASG